MGGGAHGAAVKRGSSEDAAPLRGHLRTASSSISLMSHHHALDDTSFEALEASMRAVEQAASRRDREAKKVRVET